MKSLYTSLLTFVIILTCFQHNYHPVEGKSTSHKKSIIDNLVQEKFKDKIKETFWGFFKSETQCEKTKKEGKEPSAVAGDSPLKAFGYPNFDEANQGYSTLHPGVSLSIVNKKFKQPVIAGSRDFYIAGKPDDILDFCECFQDYHVIGQTLNQDGHWKNGTGQIKIQIEDAQKWETGKGANLFDMVFKMTLDRIIKELDPEKKISASLGIIGGSLTTKLLGAADASLAAKLKNFKNHFESMKKWIPESPEILEGIKSILNEGGLSDSDMYDKLKAKVKESLDWHSKALKKQWEDKGNLDKKGNVIACITMYAKPANSLRATYTFDGADITMGDVGKALKDILP